MVFVFVFVFNLFNLLILCVWFSFIAFFYFFKLYLSGKSVRWSGVHSFYYEGVDLTVFAVSSDELL